ncbi:hypothetical protein BJ138DRAFT_1139983 [Hygrophoropsis aurantiaca]|uniref:Uncharacterized protein n=1 Tax=Hygrophoropsis aurantiaca TaxID=72124 RepID=A0ACB8AU13_9AGAM|nr:hypothetical protein BJ138DRAFT_1139983 [Hygrophoropsis aurantiaca]
MGIESSRSPPVATPTIVVTVASETDCDSIDAPEAAEDDTSPAQAAPKERYPTGPTAALLSFNKATTHECKATVSAPSINLVLQSNLSDVLDSPHKSTRPSQVNPWQSPESSDLVPSHVNKTCYSQESPAILQESFNGSTVIPVDFPSDNVDFEPASNTIDHEHSLQFLENPCNTTTDSADLSDSSVPSIIIPTTFDPSDSIDTMNPQVTEDPRPLISTNFIATAEAPNTPQSHMNVLSEIITQQDQDPAEEPSYRDVLLSPLVDILPPNVMTLPFSVAPDSDSGIILRDSIQDSTGIPQAATYAEATNLAARYPDLASEILVSPLRRSRPSDVDTALVAEDQAPPKQDSEEFTRGVGKRHRNQPKGSRKEPQQPPAEHSNRRRQERQPHRAIRVDSTAANAALKRSHTSVIQKAPGTAVHTDDNPNWAVAPQAASMIERTASLQTNHHGGIGRPPRRSQNQRGRGDKKNTQRGRRDNSTTEERHTRDTNSEGPRKPVASSTITAVQDNTRIPAPAGQHANSTRDRTELPPAVRRASYIETSGQRTSNADALLTKLFRQAMDMDNKPKESKRSSERQPPSNHIDFRKEASDQSGNKESPNVPLPLRDQQTNPKGKKREDQPRIPSTGFSFKAAPEQHTATMNEFKPVVQLPPPRNSKDIVPDRSRKSSVLNQVSQYNAYVDPFRPPMDPSVIHASHDRLRALNKVLDRENPDAAIDISAFSTKPEYRPENVMYSNSKMSARPIDLGRGMQMIGSASGGSSARPFSGGAGQMGAASLLEEQMFHRGGGVLRTGLPGTSYGQRHIALPPVTGSSIDARGERRRTGRRSSEMPTDRKSWSRS